MKPRAGYFKTLSIALMWSTVAFAAGGRSDGGGKSVVCRENGQITFAALLDLYEAARVDHVQLRKPLGSFDQDFLAFGEEWRRLSSGRYSPYSLKSFHEASASYVLFLPIGTHPKNTEDVGATIPLPPGCALEQLAHANDETGMIEIDSEIWGTLSSMDQAALFAHELLYAYYRKAGDLTSRATRKMVARLFSADPFPSQGSGIPSGSGNCQGQPKVLTDWISWFEFYYFPDPTDPNKTILQFYQLGGRSPLAPTRITLPIRIRSSGWKQTWNDSQATVWVTDPDAAIYQMFPVESGILEGYRVLIDYRYGQAFTISLYDAQDRLLSQTPISFCTGI